MDINDIMGFIAIFGSGIIAHGFRHPVFSWMAGVGGAVIALAFWNI